MLRAPRMCAACSHCYVQTKVLCFDQGAQRVRARLLSACRVIHQLKSMRLAARGTFWALQRDCIAQLVD